jgi:hypothetical protein
MNKFTKTFFFILCSFLLGACYQEYKPVATKTCTLNLQIFVHQGASASHTLSGHVEFGSDLRTSFKGDFVEENGPSHPGSFYLDGQAIHFILDLEEGRIFATGIMESNLATCYGSGGGTLSGPILGDLGDWRGEWVSTAIPAPLTQPSTNNLPSPVFLCMYSPIILVGLFLAIILFRLFAPYKLLTLFKRTPSSTHQASSSALRRTNQSIKSELKKDEQLLTEYLATYTAGDKFFDLSFQIEQSSKYVGECGVAVARVLDAKSNQATALEIWIFDPRGAQTISKILASTFCFSQTNLRSELEQIGQVILIQPGETITLVTKEIKAKAKILQVEYESGSPDHQSAFKKVVIQIGVYANTD